MHTVVETPAYISAAKDAGLSAGDRDAVVDLLSDNPLAGDAIAGTGGCRKVRVAGRGKGKRGGYRVVFFFSGEALPVFALTVFGKGDKANLTRAEQNALRDFVKTLAATYERKRTT